MDSELPTNPGMPAITVEEQLDYICGTIRKIEAQLASNDPPQWAKKLFDKMNDLEDEISRIKINCSKKHSNGNSSGLLELK